MTGSSEDYNAFAMVGANHVGHMYTRPATCLFREFGNDSDHDPAQV